MGGSASDKGGSKTRGGRDRSTSPSGKGTQFRSLKGSKGGSVARGCSASPSAGGKGSRVRSAGRGRSKSPSGKGGKEEVEVKVKYIDVRDVAVHVCLGRLQNIIDYTTPS